jgi:DNA-directed RNA polymerase specialized sigma24 family protein
VEQALARVEINRQDDARLLRAQLAGETVAQIAERLGEKKANVAMASSRARKRLREILVELGSDLALTEEGET